MYLSLGQGLEEKRGRLIVEMRRGQTSLRNLCPLAQARDEDLTKDEPSHGLRL
jgi:hypothetical protein